MPNVLDLPMKKVTNMTVNNKECIGEFSAKRATISIRSTAKSGITIQSKYKSESMLIGINDNYLASVLYRRRTYPIWIVLSVFSFFVGLLTFTGEESLVVVGLIGLILSLIFMALFFTSRTARISFRLADEQDYQILLTSGAVQDTNLMSQFISRLLMNSMNHFEEADDSTSVFGSETNTSQSGGTDTVEPNDEEPPTGTVSAQPPPVSAVAHTTDQNGFEWHQTTDGVSFFRPEGTQEEWALHQG